MSDVRCPCGALLLDEVRDTDVRLGDDAFPFSRSTDHVVCDGCGAIHRIADLRDADGERSGATEAVEALRDLALRDAPAEDPGRVVGRVPPDA